MTFFFIRIRILHSVKPKSENINTFIELQPFFFVFVFDLVSILLYVLDIWVCFWFYLGWFGNADLKNDLWSTPSYLHIVYLLLKNTPNLDKILIKKKIHSRNPRNAKTTKHFFSPIEWCEEFHEKKVCDTNNSMRYCTTGRYLMPNNRSIISIRITLYSTLVGEVSTSQVVIGRTKHFVQRSPTK